MAINSRARPQPQAQAKMPGMGTSRASASVRAERKVHSRTLMRLGWRSAKDAFEREAERVFPSIFGTALRLTRSREDAEDLAQETIVRAYGAFDRFDGSNFKAWALRILTNLYINRYRQRQRTPQSASLEDEGVLEPVALEGQEPDRLLLDNLVGAEVESALQRVPEDFRLAVILSDIEGLTYQEIADATNVPIGTVRSRLARGRAILRGLLESYARREGYLKEETIE
jgi:RNA polymerase sigma-70 factor (ECF subfamily)